MTESSLTVRVPVYREAKMRLLGMVVDNYSGRVVLDRTPGGPLKAGALLVATYATYGSERLERPGLFALGRVIGPVVDVSGHSSVLVAQDCLWIEDES